jgi:chromosome segregation ATPase
MKPINHFTEKYNLEKIPDSILLKQALIENGKLQAYIEELESKLKTEDFVLYSNRINNLTQQYNSLTYKVNNQIAEKARLQNELKELLKELQEVKKESHFYKTYEM